MSDEIGIPVALLSITVKNDGFGTSLEDFPSRISVLMLSAEIPGRTNPPPRCVESRSPGKERDLETGLDYFGARYGKNILDSSWAGFSALMNSPVAP